MEVHGVSISGQIGDLPYLGLAPRRSVRRSGEVVYAANRGTKLLNEASVGIEILVQRLLFSLALVAACNRGRRLRRLKCEGESFSQAFQLGDRVQIVSGLKTGDRVVVSGTFLMDSESRLKATAAGSPAPKMEMAAMKDDSGHHHSEMSMAKTTEAQAHSVKDLSCGMDIDPAVATAAGNTASYRGATYYFCSTSCKSKFEKDPERYVASSHKGPSHD